MIWLNALWSKFYAYILAFGAAVVAILAIFYRGKSEGRAEVKEQVREATDAAKERKEKVKPIDAVAVARRMRKRNF